MALADTIRAWLVYYGWSPSDLARRSRVGRSTLSEVLSGRSASLSGRNLQAVAVALGTTTDALLAGLPPGEAPLVAVHPVLAAALRQFGPLLSDADYARVAGYLAALADHVDPPAPADQVAEQRGQEVADQGQARMQ